MYPEKIRKFRIQNYAISDECSQITTTHSSVQNNKKIIKEKTHLNLKQVTFLIEQIQPQIIAAAYGNSIYNPLRYSSNRDPLVNFQQIGSHSGPRKNQTDVTTVVTRSTPAAAKCPLVRFICIKRRSQQRGKLHQKKISSAKGLVAAPSYANAVRHVYLLWFFHSHSNPCDWINLDAARRPTT